MSLDRNTMSFSFQPINTEIPILESPPIYSSDILTDSLYLQQVKEKLRELDDKIRYYQIHHPHHREIGKMKLNKKLINQELFKKKKIFD